MFTLTRSNPSLPQQESVFGRTRRTLALDAERFIYQWNDNSDNLKGVPMVAKLPLTEYPSAVWLGKVLKVAIDIVENLIAIKFTEASSDVIELEGQAVNVRHKLSELKALSASVNQSVDTVENHFESIITQAAEHVSVLASVVSGDVRQSLDEVQALIQGIVDVKADPGSVSSLQEYKDLFKTIPLPEIASEFCSDESFVRLKIAGPNPMLISQWESLPVNLAVKADDISHLLVSGDTLDKALQNQRVYGLDYQAIENLTQVLGETNGKAKFLYAPLALFVLKPDRSQLVPVAIQLGQSPNQDPVIIPGRDDEQAWLLAKTQVNYADTNYHELFVHLARTHLVEEAFAIATHRELAPSHPINILLLPHFEGTMLINSLAESSLVAPDGAIDHLFASRIRDIQASAGADRLEYSIIDSIPHTDFKRRGVDNTETFPDYPYRDDALLVWQAIESWIIDYVDIYYREDSELHAWRKEIITQGKVKGLPELDTKTELVQLLTQVIFIASAQHAAVNFPQQPIMSFAPVMTGASWQPFPGRDVTQADWINSMPSQNLALEQLNLLFLLGSVYYRPLGDYRESNFPYHEWFQDPRVTEVGGPLDRFRLQLKDVEATINQRNAELDSKNPALRKQAYEFLLPSKIPSSVNI